jgi:hypothetical protein
MKPAVLSIFFGIIAIVLWRSSVPHFGQIDLIKPITETKQIDKMTANMRRGETDEHTSIANWGFDEHRFYTLGSDGGVLEEVYRENWGVGTWIGMIFLTLVGCLLISTLAMGILMFFRLRGVGLLVPSILIMWSLLSIPFSFFTPEDPSDINTVAEFLGASTWYVLVLSLFLSIFGLISIFLYMFHGVSAEQLWASGGEKRFSISNSGQIKIKS